MLPGRSRYQWHARSSGCISQPNIRGNRATSRTPLSGPLVLLFRRPCLGLQAGQGSGRQRQVSEMCGRSSFEGTNSWVRALHAGPNSRRMPRDLASSWTAPSSEGQRFGADTPTRRRETERRCVPRWLCCWILLSRWDRRRPRQVAANLQRRRLVRGQRRHCHRRRQGLFGACRGIPRLKQALEATSC